ncbi:MAG: type II toxin-antitoxin system Phd/YefM family antitoxin [Kiritimatiellae bacterium]|nr:type II toxin-antitoxin system Phd/YefM family antitoxin [Kiritimatiellia bacterium]
MPTPLPLDLKEDIVPFTQFRSALSSYMQQARRTHRPIVVTQNGRAASVLLDVEAYEALREEAEIRREIEQAETDAREGRTVPQEKARARVLAGLRK